MAKKSKKNKKPQNREYLNQIRYLEILLNISLKSVDGRSEQLDMLFANQARRIQLQINKLKENNGLR